jgi:hypothetical protein
MVGFGGDFIGVWIRIFGVLLFVRDAFEMVCFSRARLRRVLVGYCSALGNGIHN